MGDSLRKVLKNLYFGTAPAARRFRFASFLFEIFLVVFFVSTSFVTDQDWLIVAELPIAAILFADFLARWWMSEPQSAYFKKISTWTDIAVLITLIIPAITGSLLFLRAVRAVRLFRSYHFLRDIYAQYTFVQKNRDAIEASINLLIFIFVMSAVVFVVERRHPSVNNFLDALYFTVSTLTTTGFGDITFRDMPGRLLSIFIMIVGVSLFLRLIQTVFRPAKVRYECPTCGLSRHDQDAVHCKHCGLLLHIETEGLD